MAKAPASAVWQFLPPLTRDAEILQLGPIATSHFRHKLPQTRHEVSATCSSIRNVQGEVVQ